MKKTLPLFLLIIVFLFYCLFLNEINSIEKIIIIFTIIFSVGLYLYLNIDYIIDKNKK